MHPRRLLLAAVTSFVVLFGAELGMRRYVAGRFIPAVTFERAVAAGDGCIVTVGDSRMVAGVRAKVLESELGRLGAPACVAELAIGAGTIEVQHVAVRRYLARDRRPKLFVVGVSPESILSDEVPPEPASFVGNQAVVLGWSELRDVTLLYPGFPKSHFDSGLRFLLTGSTALGSYASLVWAKVGAAQDRLAGAEIGPTNQFGQVSAMRDFAEQLRKHAVQRLPRFPAHSPLHPAFLAMLAHFERAQAPFLLVEVPTPPGHRDTLHRFPETRLVRAAVSALARDAGGVFVVRPDASDFGNAFFPDGLHLGPDGAEMFSSSLAATVRRALVDLGVRP
jgi:hypothetical protein